MKHEYPPNRTLDSVSVARVCALRAYGWTQRQREFLVTVMVHSGCFLERQYCAFTGSMGGRRRRSNGADRLWETGRANPDGSDRSAEAASPITAQKCG